MVDQFFSCTLVKNPALAMCAYTNNIHINHLVKMYNPVLNIFSFIKWHSKFSILLSVANFLILLSTDIFSASTFPEVIFNR